MLKTVTCGLLLVGFLLTITLQEAVQNKFSCQGRPSGYYADIDSGCQIYHMCDGLGRQFSYSCPNTTLFQQRMLICDHWYMVNCSRSEVDYTANLLIGQQKPFVEDSDKQIYYRTPRPDLLTQPTASELNIIYRTGLVRNHTDFSLVGINSDYDQNNGSSAVTAKSTYHLPSHWSTEYSKIDETTASSVNKVSYQKNRDKQTVIPPLIRILQESQRNTVEPVRDAGVKLIIRNRENAPSVQDLGSTTRPRVIPQAKAINFDSNNLDNIINLKPSNIFPKKDVVVNFKSAFKATTPVFPTKEELVTTESPFHDILKPPISENELKNIISDREQNVIVNFQSRFKATTPVFPTKEELGTTEAPVDDIIQAPNSESQVEDVIILPNQDIVVNFNSLFQATTPVFPTKNELGTTESPVDDILKPPSAESSAVPVPVPAILFQPPVLQSTFDKEESSTEPNKYTVKLESNKNIKSKTKIATRLNNEKVLKELRKMFSIPDYDFALDTIARPGYDLSVDSFQANPFLVDVQPRQHAS